MMASGPDVAAVSSPESPEIDKLTALVEQLAVGQQELCTEHIVPIVNRLESAAVVIVLQNVSNVTSLDILYHGFKLQSGAPAWVHELP